MKNIRTSALFLALALTTQIKADTILSVSGATILSNTLVRASDGSHTSDNSYTSDMNSFAKENLNQDERQKLKALREDAINFIAHGEVSTSFKYSLNELREHHIGKDMTDDQVAGLIISVTADL